MAGRIPLVHLDPSPIVSQAARQLIHLSMKSLPIVSLQLIEPASFHATTWSVMVPGPRDSIIWTFYSLLLE